MEKIYKMSIQKTVHTLLNIENENYITSKMILNRNVKNKSQNKLGPHNPELGRNNLEQKSFLYQSVKLYNELPKELTKIRKPWIFKKWIKKYEKTKTLI